MAYVPGTDTALLPKVILATEAAWPQNQQTIETKDVQAGTFEALLKNQQALGSEFMRKLTDPDKEHDVKVYWPDFCGKEAADCSTDPCSDITGDMADVKEKAYSISSCVEYKFSIDEDKLKTSVIAPEKHLLDSSNFAIKALLQKLNAKAIAFLDANKGYNGGGQFDVTSLVSEVPATEYTMDLMPKITLDMVVNKVPNAFVIDGRSLFLPYMNAKLNGANAEGKGDAARANLFTLEQDVNGFAGASLSDRTFVVAPYSYAFMTKNYIKNRVPEYEAGLFGGKGGYKYNMPVPAYGLVIDVFYQRVCVDAAKDKYKLVFLYKVHFDFEVNPAGCDDGDGNIVTGIWAYKKLPAA